jgi:SAM-dependent methyltransferase
LNTDTRPLLHWTEAGGAHAAHWQSERGAPPPERVTVVDDTLSADVAYRLACNGTALLWRGDFNNGRQLLQAMARRADKHPLRARKAKAPQTVSPRSTFDQHRQAQQRRARVLSQLLVRLDAHYLLHLPRAPDVQRACIQAWGEPHRSQGALVVSMRELLGVMSTAEWRKKGVEIPALGAPPHNRIHPHYGVFSPVRGEYIDLVASTPLPRSQQVPFTAFDVGTGTGVLAAVLARRGIARVIGTEQDPRALTCAQENVAQLGLGRQVQIVNANLFPEGRAALVVCNPPWLPATPSAPIERSVYDENSQMLLGFINGLSAHLTRDGEGWLILSDLAEHLGLRTREMLLGAIAAAGLQVVGREDTTPHHPKANDPNDPLHAARAAETTSLWRLTHL